MSRGRKPLPVIPLTPEQQQVVTEWLPTVNGIACKMWRWLHTSARHLDDLKSQAAFLLCKAVSRFNPNKMRSLKIKIILDVRQGLVVYIRKYIKGHWIEADVLEDVNDSSLIQQQVTYDDDSEVSIIPKLLSVVTDRQQAILGKRYGLDGDLPMSQREAAKALNITPNIVHHQENAAIRRIYQAFEKEMSNATR